MLIIDFTYTLLGYIFRMFPLKNRILASTAYGRKYADNPRYVVEEVIKLSKDIEVYWILKADVKCQLPTNVKRINITNPIKLMYLFSTSKVILDSHKTHSFFRKRKGQLFINTWHGGLGIKKIGLSMSKSSSSYRKALLHTVNSTDIFISNSDFQTNVYRNSFHYKGKVWNIGYPKTDVLFGDKESIRTKIRKELSLPSQIRIALYAPTYRDSDRVDHGANVYKTCNIDFNRLVKSLEIKTGEKWIVLVKLHPFLMHLNIDLVGNCSCAKDVTNFNDMQSLEKASDLLITDYSSCIFDTGLMGIPSILYATDFEEYQAEQGTYMQLEELPFPVARNNDQLEAAIQEYDKNVWDERWQKYTKECGLVETGHASRDVANFIIKYIETGEICV